MALRIDAADLIHFPEPHRSSVNMSILIREITGIEIVPGSEIAAFTPDSIVAGAVALEGDTQWGMAVWKDDETTDEIDGFQEGDTIRFVFWDPILEMEMPAVVFEIVEGDEKLHFESNGLLVIKLNVEVPEIPPHPPEWIDVPEEKEGEEGGSIEFEIRGRDVNGDDLSITFYSEDLPETADFTDHGNGTGTFQWFPGFFDAGSYTAFFTLSDGSLDTTADVRIIVYDRDMTPEWIDVPEEEEGQEGGSIEFEIQGRGINQDVLKIEYFSPDIPNTASFVDHGNGTGTFQWFPGFFDAGTYTAYFTLSDDSLDTTAEVRITVYEHVAIVDYYRFEGPYPNPFNRQTLFNYKIPDDVKFTVETFDSLGRFVKTVDYGFGQGDYSVEFDCSSLASGIYFFRLKAGSVHKHLKGILIRKTLEVCK